MSCPHASELGAFALGHVPGSAGAAQDHPLEHHLAGCPSCRSELADLTAVTALLATVRQHGLDVADTAPLAFPDDLLERVLAAIASERAAERRSRRRGGQGGSPPPRRLSCWDLPAGCSSPDGTTSSLLR